MTCIRRLVLDLPCLLSLIDGGPAFAEIVGLLDRHEARLYVPAAFIPLIAPVAPALLTKMQIVPSRRTDLSTWMTDPLRGAAALAATTAERVQAHALVTCDTSLVDQPRVCTPQQIGPHLSAVRFPPRFIDLAQAEADLLEEIDSRIDRVIRHGRFIHGPEVAELEAALCARLGIRHTLAVSSGTHALEIALRALGIGPGDEVITVPFTWISTAEVIPLVGAHTVFVDISADSFCLDVDLVEAAITPRTKAIIAVSLFGQVPELERLAELAQRHGITIIEDAAQSFGATRHGRASGTITRIGCTSFFPSKPLGCFGDGGAIFTDDDALASRMRAIRTHGGEQRHHHTQIGLNGRFDTLQAAVVLARLGRTYAKALAGICRTPIAMAGNYHVWAQYTIRMSDRDAAAARLERAGIPSAVYYPICLHQQPAFAGHHRAGSSLARSEQAAGEVLSLPIHPYLEAEDITVTANALGHRP